MEACLAYGSFSTSWYLWIKMPNYRIVVNPKLRLQVVQVGKSHPWEYPTK